MSRPPDINNVFVVKYRLRGVLLQGKGCLGKNKVQAIASKNVAAENKNTAQTSGQKSDNGQKQPKKKNRKRVAERLAAQEAEKNAEENKTE